MRTNIMIQEAKNKTIIDKNGNQYSVGILAEGNCVSKGCDEVYLDYLRLRANVYAIQNDYISRELILDDGTEKDEEDSRSVHFGVIDNYGDNPHIVAAMRLILKNDMFDNPLPIEKYFTNVFVNMPIPHNNVELSRFICQHENKVTQMLLMWPLLAIGTSYAIQNNLEMTYAVIEPFLERILKFKGLTMKRLADPEFVLQYNSTNIPVLFNTILVAKILESKNPGIIDALGDSNGKFVRFGICDTKGILYENN